MVLRKIRVSKIWLSFILWRTKDIIKSKDFFTALCANETLMWGIETKLKANTLPLSTKWVRNQNSKRFHWSQKSRIVIQRMFLLMSDIKLYIKCIFSNIQKLENGFCTISNISSMSYNRCSDTVNYKYSPEAQICTILNCELAF